jgi:tRNA 2-selenouridine synthase
MAHILAQVGWNTSQLDGGYKNYRRHVIAGLEALPMQFDFRVISGVTGSGKSHLLHALAAQGAQVLDLEALAQHRGSLLGRLPDQAQPSQKTFETRLWQTLQAFTAARPVYIEAESRKVGVLSLPNALVERMRVSPVVQLEVPQAARVQFLMQDYAHFLDKPSLLAERLSLLLEMHGRTVIKRWCAMAEAGDWVPLVEELLTRHYDPAYQRSSSMGYQQQADVIALEVLDSASLHQAAENLIRKESKNND